MPQVFQPKNTNAIAATAATQTRAFPTGGPGDCCVFYNDGPGIAFVATGAAAMTVTLPAVSGIAGAEGTGTPVPVGTSVNFTHLPADTNWAVICPAAGTASVYCTVGTGV